MHALNLKLFSYRFEARSSNVYFEGRYSLWPDMILTSTKSLGGQAHTIHDKVIYLESENDIFATKTTVN